MTTITINRDGEEFVHTNVIIPRYLKDSAKEQKVSLSKTLRIALESILKEGDAGAKQLPTNEAPTSLSIPQEEVDV